MNVYSSPKKTETPFDYRVMARPMGQETQLGGISLFKVTREILNSSIFNKFLNSFAGDSVHTLFVDRGVGMEPLHPVQILRKTVIAVLRMVETYSSTRVHLGHWN